ncbi:MAG: hypothetical protein ACE5K0_02135 [Candidatus Methanofastidiosia archaeon]
MRRICLKETFWFEEQTPKSLKLTKEEFQRFSKIAEKVCKNIHDYYINFFLYKTIPYNNKLAFEMEVKPVLDEMIQKAWELFYRDTK